MVSSSPVCDLLVHHLCCALSLKELSSAEIVSGDVPVDGKAVVPVNAYVGMKEGFRSVL